MDLSGAQPAAAGGTMLATHPLATSLCTLLCSLWPCLMHDPTPVALLQGNPCQQRVMLRCAV